MAAFDTVRPQPGFASRLGHVLVAAVSAFAAWNDARASRIALHALSDRELDDIGLVRGDIDLIASRRR